MFIFILDPTRTGGVGPLEISPLPSNGRRGNNPNPNPQFDSNGVLQEIPGSGKPSADEHLPPIFRHGVRLALASNHENRELVAGLFFADEEARLAYISQVYSLEVRQGLEEMEDLQRCQELETVLMIGSIDPNPNGPLGQLLSIVGGLRFPESVSIVLGKIAVLNDLAQYLLRVAAEHGDSGPALEYAAQANRASGSTLPPAPNGTSLQETILVTNGQTTELISIQDDNLRIANTPVGSTNSVVEHAVAKAEKVNKGRQDGLTVEARIAELETQIANSTNPIEQSNFRRLLADLAIGNHIATA